MVKKCLEYWKKARLLILLAKTFANFGIFENLPLSTNMFYNFEEKKRTLSKMIWGKKKQKKLDFITPKRLRENICPQRLLLLSEGNPLCLYYRLVKENRSSWLRTNNRPRRNFLLFLKGNIITLKTFSLWRALFCYVSSKLFFPILIKDQRECCFAKQR